LRLTLVWSITARGGALPAQDGAVFVDMGKAGWAAYCTAFTQQLVPTDNLGNPGKKSHEVTDQDPGSLA